MKKRLLYGSAVLVLAVLVALVVWQSSFTLGSTSAAGPEQTFLLWAVSILVFVLTVTLAFMLVRTFVKLYVERHSNREGSRIRTKLVVGALALCITPVFFQVLFSFSILNFNLTRWFSYPGERVKVHMLDIGDALERETQDEVRAQARWIAGMPETQVALNTGAPDRKLFDKLCRENDIVTATLESEDGRVVRLCNQARDPKDEFATASAPLRTSVGAPHGRVFLRGRMALDLRQHQQEIKKAIDDYYALDKSRKQVRTNYTLLLLLITLFILYLAVWIALFLARQISVPIAALLAAAREVRSGNLSYRVRVEANDELASLVRAFNEMTQDLDANSRELERRRRFTETILECIPSGVLSVTADGRILKVNRALGSIFSEERVSAASLLSDLLDGDDLAEIRYVMNRARRTGVAGTQLELRRDNRVLQLSVTAAALEDQSNSGVVLVIEDTSELLRAQKAAAWQEVARRVAHEIKNPLTPISLSAERIARQLAKPQITDDTRRILRECSGTITEEVEMVRTLVDEFSQFSRFPTAQPVPADLNEVVEAALATFQGRLEGIELHVNLAPGLPQVRIDREQFKRVLVNLIDNAAEAMGHSMVRRLYIGTTLVSPETIELVVADTGCGISAEDKEKLFLPYFSTKQRGTGLGLAIVSHIVADHGGAIRVEDNRPSGARFIIELPTLAAAEADAKPLEVRA